MRSSLDRGRYAEVPAELRDRLFGFVDSAELKEVAVGDLSWQYLDFGPVVGGIAPGNAPPMVFFSGGAKLPVYSFAVIDALGQQNRVIAIAQPPCRTLEEHFAGVDVVLQREGITRFHVAGSSWGGCVAQAAALRYTDRVDRMVLSSTGLAGGKAVVLMLRLHLGSVRRADPDKVVAGFRARALGLLARDEGSHALWEALFADVYDRTFTHRDYVSLIETQLDYVSRWAPLIADQPWPRPVMIITTKDEAAGTGAWRAAILRAYPLAEHRVLEGGGHHPALSRADEYRSSVAEFLAGKRG